MRLAWMQGSMSQRAPPPHTASSSTASNVTNLHSLAACTRVAVHRASCIGGVAFAVDGGASASSTARRAARTVRDVGQREVVVGAVAAILVAVPLA